MIYRIKNWEKHFENNRTRELKTLTWVPFPNKHDGDGYTELVTHPNGAAYYGAWCALVQVASKCDPRGTLLRDGATPHDSASLARKTRLSEGVFEELLPRLLAIGWLECISSNGKVLEQIPQGDATIPQGDAPRVCAQEGKGREGKGREGKGKRESKNRTKDTTGESEKLGELVRACNSLPKGMMPKTRNDQSKAILKGWSAVRRNSETIHYFDDPQEIVAKIRKAKFVHGQNWFRLAWLFAKGKTREWNIIKLMEGAYDDGRKETGPDNPNTSPGVRYDPDRPCEPL